MLLAFSVVWSLDIGGLLHLDPRPAKFLLDRPYIRPQGTRAVQCLAFLSRR
jgi:hypothetical protein